MATELAQAIRMLEVVYMIKGITIALKQKIQTGIDTFNAPIYTDNWVSVDNVLVGQPTTEDITTDNQLYGKQVAYILGIPKGDDHNWIDTEVEFFGQRFKTYGFPTKGIDENVPGPWNMKVKVEAYG